MLFPTFSEAPCIFPVNLENLKIGQTPTAIANAEDFTSNVRERQFAHWRGTPRVYNFANIKRLHFPFFSREQRGRHMLRHFFVVLPGAAATTKNVGENRKSL